MTPSGGVMNADGLARRQGGDLVLIGAGGFAR